MVDRFITGGTADNTLTPTAIAVRADDVQTASQRLFRLHYEGDVTTFSHCGSSKPLSDPPGTNCLERKRAVQHP